MQRPQSQPLPPACCSFCFSLTKIKLSLNPVEKLLLTLVVVVLSCYQKRGRGVLKHKWIFLKGNLILWVAEHLVLHEKHSWFLLGSVGALVLRSSWEVLSLGQDGTFLFGEPFGELMLKYIHVTVWIPRSYSLSRDLLRGECGIIMPCTSWVPFIFPNIY